MRRLSWPPRWWDRWWKRGSAPPSGDSTRPKGFTIYIGIRWQLMLLTCVVMAVSLTFLAIVTGVSTENYNMQLTEEGLAGVAALKASQLEQVFSSAYLQTYWLTTRSQLQLALNRYRAGNTTEQNWGELRAFFNSTASTNPTIYAVAVYGTDYEPLFNMSSEFKPGYNELDQFYPFAPGGGGSTRLLETTTTIITGPYSHDSDWMMSISLPVIANSTILVSQPVLSGYMTLLMSTESFEKVVYDTSGLSGGCTMLVGWYEDASSGRFRFLLPSEPPCPYTNESLYAYKYPPIKAALTSSDAGAVVNAELLGARNTALGYSTVNLGVTRWGVLVEEPHDEVYAKVKYLRNIVIGTSFGIAGFVVLIMFPLAYFAVQPILRLRHATEQGAAEFLGPTPSSSQKDLKAIADGDGSGGGPGGGPGGDSGGGSGGGGDAAPAGGVRGTAKGGSGISGPAGGPTHGGEKSVSKSASTTMASEGSAGSSSAVDSTAVNTVSERDPRVRLPTEVRRSRKFFRDELTDLSEAHNLMVEELRKRYGNLEDQVRERTRELERAKIHAERANEAKSLFIANITHELRTPLNGILGMTAVSMTEKDPEKIRRSLQIITDSGKVLMELLTNLLTFSKNEVGTVSLDEREFALQAVKADIMALYSVPAAEKNITLTCDVAPNVPPSLILYGDFSRVFQVLVNLVSNSLKFTENGGFVKVRIRPVLAPSTAPTPAASTPAPTPAKTRARPSSADVKPSANNHSHTASSAHSLNGASDGARPSTPPPDTLLSSLRTGRHGRGGDLFQKLKSSKRSFAAFDQESGSELDGERPRAGSVGSNNSSTVSASVPPSSAPTTGPAAHSGSFWEFEVEDNGVGMAPDVQDKIFEPFVQADQALTRQFGGSGLGLSICRQLAEALHGSIFMRSELGVGSTFTLRVPLRIGRKRPSSHPVSAGEYSLGVQPRNSVSRDFLPKDASAAATAVSVTAKSKRPLDLRVLIADDNNVNVEVMKRMLLLESVAQVDCVGDGKQAITKVEEAIRTGQHYHIVFVDLKMPVMNGLDAVKVIRETLGYPYPIVALTGFSDEATAKMCLDARMDDVLVKPVLREQLQAILRKHCSSDGDNENDDPGDS